MVVMADGSTVEISRIQVGDEVQSRTIHVGGHTTVVAKVAFVSKPRRARRALYSYRDAPRVRFTDTHPIVEAGRNWHSNGELALQFVNPDLACAMNSTWHSVPVLQIPPDVIVCHDRATSDPGETLYDLVFAPSPRNNCCPGKCAGVTTYFVADQMGHEFEVASEAPLFEWFPYSMTFFHSLLHALLRNDDDVASVFALLLDPDIIVKGPWRTIAEKTWIDNSARPSTPRLHQRGPFSPTIILGLLPDNAVDETISPQVVADAFESLHSTFGRVINHELSIGWAYNFQNEINDSADLVPLLILHSLHFTGLTTTPTQAGSHAHGSHWVHISQNHEQVLTHNVSWHRRGWQTFDYHSSIDISTLSSSIDGHGQSNWTIGLEVHDPLTNTTYRGQSVLYENTVTLVGLGNTEISNQHVILDIRVMRVARNVLRDLESWDEEKMAVFAEGLGASFAATLVEQVAQTGPSNISRRDMAEYAQ